MKEGVDCFLPVADPRRIFVELELFCSRLNNGVYVESRVQMTQTENHELIARGHWHRPFFTGPVSLLPSFFLKEMYNLRTIFIV